MIEKFTARPAEEILLDLYALKLRERDGEKMEPPVLTLLLGGNRTPVNGFLIDMKKEVNSKQVVVQSQNTNDVLFIDMYAVAGIVLHDADRIVPFLIDLAPDDTSKMLPVTRLDVKKQQAEVTANLNLHFKGIALLFNEELPAIASELYFARQFLTDISMALITLGKTTIGKQIIQNEIKTVQITRGTPLQIKRDHDGIVVQYPFNKMYTNNIERHFLTDRLSEIL